MTETGSFLSSFDTVKSLQVSTLQTEPQVIQPFTHQTQTQNLHQRFMAHQILRKWGNTSTSYMTLNRGNRYFFEERGEAYLAYRERLGVVISIGDPVGPPEATRRCIVEFIGFCQQKRRVPAFFAIEKDADFLAQLQMRNIQIAANPYLNLKTLQFKGKSWQDVRTALNRAKREGITIEQYDPHYTSKDVFDQLAQISKEWIHCKKLPELGFTLGDLSTIQDKAVRTFYAVNAAQEVQGFVSWLPIYGNQGWTLDLMRRRKEGAMQGIMEFLIASSALRFGEENYTWLNLGACPFANIPDGRELTRLERLTRHFTPLFNHFYSFNSLFTFKRKFQPEWKPLYLFYPSIRGLPQIGLSTFSLYLFCHSR